MTTHSITADRRMAVAPRTLRRLRACLLEERRRRLVLAANQARRAGGLAGGDLGDETERHLALALAAQAREIAEEIQLALGRMDSDSFGRCEGCGHPLSPARLEAVPYARGCVECHARGALAT